MLFYTPACEKATKEGWRQFVILTFAGSPVLGGIDPFAGISMVWCKVTVTESSGALLADVIAVMAGSVCHPMLVEVVANQSYVSKRLHLSMLY